MSTDVGALYRTTLAVVSASGQYVTPGAVALSVTLPDMTIASGAVVTDSTGQFHCDYLMTMPGLHKFTWSSVGPNSSETDYENAINYRSVVGLAEMRKFLGITDTSRDDVLRDVLGAATHEAEKICGTLVPMQVTNEHIPGNTRQTLRLPSGPVLDATSVSIQSEFPGGPQWTNDMLLVYTESGVIETLSMLGFWFGPWKATYTAGRAELTPALVLGVKEIVFDLWANQRMITADQLEPGLVETARYETMLPQGYRIPPHARALLETEPMPGFG